MSLPFSPEAEWLETDGLGGFAMGTVSGVRNRRYHALLIHAATPPTGRLTLVNGFDAFVETASGRFAITSQRYAPSVLTPDGQKRLISFRHEPWPVWTFALEDGTQVEHDLFMPKGRSAVCLRWRLLKGSVARLAVRPFLSGRGYHQLQSENAAFAFAPEVDGDRLRWEPYEGVPSVTARTNGAYRHEPCWYRNFLYSEEEARGLDHLEDLAAPGSFEWDLAKGEAYLIWMAAAEGLPRPAEPTSAVALHLQLRQQEERRRGGFPSPLHRAADAYLVQRGDGLTLIAGYPWFTDWGRDTFISLRGLCLATGRLSEAEAILRAWAGMVSEGMLPNRFPDEGEAAEFNAVDASLWFIVAVHEFREACRRAGQTLPSGTAAPLERATQSILAGYRRGTRYGIRADSDGLLTAGRPGVQLTWMDAKQGDCVVTPRIGKPVEVQALWLNALWIGSHAESGWKPLLETARASFADRFWNAERGCLFDVVDADHVPGKADPALRPNQLLAVGGLPLQLLPEEKARQVVALAEKELLTPLGLRTLAPSEPGYRGRYEGGPTARDGAYHQGTVWPWLLGPFAEAWVRVNGGTVEAKQQARERFLLPLRKQLRESGLGHVSECADGDPPHVPRGCPFQAWSLGELLRLESMTLT